MRHSGWRPTPLPHRYSRVQTLRSTNRAAGHLQREPRPRRRGASRPGALECRGAGGPQPARRLGWLSGWVALTMRIAGIVGGIGPASTMTRRTYLHPRQISVGAHPGPDRAGHAGSAGGDHPLRDDPRWNRCRRVSKSPTAPARRHGRCTRIRLGRANDFGLRLLSDLVPGVGDDPTRPLRATGF